MAMNQTQVERLSGVLIRLVSVKPVSIYQSLSSTEAVPPRILKLGLTHYVIMNYAYGDDNVQSIISGLR